MAMMAGMEAYCRRLLLEIRNFEQKLGLLLGYKANVDVQDGQHVNALYAAMALDKDLRFKRLLQKDAGTNILNRFGQHVLIAAIRMGSEECVEPLPEYGADAKAEDEQFTNVLIAAI